jgi:hypothetical protein
MLSPDRRRKTRRGLYFSQVLRGPRVKRVIVLGVLALLAGGFAISLSYQIIQTTPDYVAKATVFGAAATILGTIFSAVYNEISSYYKDRSVNLEKKWKLILPLIEKHYYPWVNIAIDLQTALKRIKFEHPVSNYDSINLLFLIMLFFGYRLRFILQDGGFILLSTPEEGKRVWKAYRRIERHLKWNGERTGEAISHLQRLYLSKEKPNKPYVQEEFANEVRKTARLRSMNRNLRVWLANSTSKKELTKLDKALRDFIWRFGFSIDTLYSAWQT